MKQTILDVKVISPERLREKGYRWRFPMLVVITNVSKFFENAENFDYRQEDGVGTHWVPVDYRQLIGREVECSITSMGGRVMSLDKRQAQWIKADKEWIKENLELNPITRCYEPKELYEPKEEPKRKRLTINRSKIRKVK